MFGMGVHTPTTTPISENGFFVTSKTEKAIVATTKASAIRTGQKFSKI